MIVDCSEASLERAARIIRDGGLVAFPTETVYGLGANALDASAVRRIFDTKGRPLTSPLIVHAADAEMARSLAEEWPQIAAEVARRFWPGPLTIVVPKAAAIPMIVTAGLQSVGIRVPSHPAALALIRACGVPLAAPSANRFTQLSPTTVAHVEEALGRDVDLILDGGPTQVGIESTVVSLVRQPPAVLRPGMISVQELENATGIQWDGKPAAAGVAESPGMHPRHYAPRTPFYVLEPGAPLPAGNGRIIEMPWDARAYAACLYAELHQADTEGWDWIAVDQPPDSPEWAGVLDRLNKASTRLPRA